jgi:hypothetical protein
MFRNIAPHQSSPPSFLTPNQPTFNPVTPEPVAGPVNPGDTPQGPQPGFGMPPQIDPGFGQPWNPGFQIDPGMGGGPGMGGLFGKLFGNPQGPQGPQMGFGMPAQGYDQQPQQTPNADAVLGSLGPLFGQMFGQGQLTSGPINPGQQNNYSTYSSDDLTGTYDESGDMDFGD